MSEIKETTANKPRSNKEIRLEIVGKIDGIMEGAPPEEEGKVEGEIEIEDTTNLVDEIDIESDSDVPLTRMEKIRKLHEIKKKEREEKRNEMMKNYYFSDDESDDRTFTEIDGKLALDKIKLKVRSPKKKDIKIPRVNERRELIPKPPLKKPPLKGKKEILKHNLDLFNHTRDSKDVKPIKDIAKPVNKNEYMNIMIRGANEVLKEMNDELEETFKKYNAELKDIHPHLKVKYKRSTSKNDMQYIYYYMHVLHKEGKNWKTVDKPDEINPPKFNFDGHTFHKISRSDIIFMSEETLIKLRKYFKECEVFEINKKYV